jgi:hypothetical protein
VASLAQSTLNLEKLTGDLNSVARIPKDDNADQWGQLYDKLGRPKLPAEYGLKPLEGTDGAFIETAATWMHEAGLSGKQARTIADKWNSHIAESLKAQTTEAEVKHNTQIEQLKKDWGADYEKHVSLVDNAISKFGMTNEQLLALKAAMGPGDSMKFLHNIGKSLGVESNFIGNGGGGGFNGTTAEQAKAQIDMLRKDHAFIQRFQANDAEARKEMDRLHKLAYPGDMTF